MVVFMGKSSINGPFSMAMLNNQRVCLTEGNYMGPRDEGCGTRVGPLSFTPPLVIELLKWIIMLSGKRYQKRELIGIHRWFDGKLKDPMGFTGINSLGNIHTSMEHHHFSLENSPFLWPCSIAM